jgi:hypothetical protein
VENGSNNPGDFVESRIMFPGASQQQFDQDTRTQLDAKYTAIGNQADSTEPYAVNESETGAFLGNVNYSPYTQCPN